MDAGLPLARRMLRGAFEELHAVLAAQEQEMAQQREIARKTKWARLDQGHDMLLQR